MDPAHTAGSIAPGLLGPKHQLTFPELVGACGCYLRLHLLESLLMSLGTTPVRREGLGVTTVEGMGNKEWAVLRRLLCSVVGVLGCRGDPPFDGAVVLIDEVPGLT